MWVNILSHPVDMNENLGFINLSPELTIKATCDFMCGTNHTSSVKWPCLVGHVKCGLHNQSCDWSCDPLDWSLEPLQNKRGELCFNLSHAWDRAIKLTLGRLSHDQSCRSVAWSVVGTTHNVTSCFYSKFQK